MAYIKPGQSAPTGNNGGGFRNNAAVAGAPHAETKLAAGVIGRTGVFKPKKPGKVLATVSTKEDMFLPAGTRINVYQNEVTSDKSPILKLEFREPEVKVS